jgi:hypothetical protein
MFDPTLPVDIFLPVAVFADHNDLYRAVDKQGRSVEFIPGRESVGCVRSP